jgi:5,10-methenyltetrahydromethanopterin hydrogenase
MIHQAEELLVPLRNIVSRETAATIAFIMSERDGVLSVLKEPDVSARELTLVIQMESARRNASGVILVEERGDRARLVLQTEDGLGMTWTAPINGDRSLGEWAMTEGMEAAVEFYGKFVIPRSLPEEDEEAR